MKYAALAAILLSSVALADDQSFVKYGVGVAGSGKDSLAETKLLSIGYKSNIWSDYLIGLWEAGGFVDVTGSGRASSAFGFGGAGVYVDSGPLYLQNTFEIGLITNPDSYLGGPFQFSEDIGVGLKSKSGASIGVNYKHISSAGIELPNKGRDFMTFVVGIPL